MAKYIESIVGITVLILVFCQGALLTVQPKACFQLCKLHVRAFPTQMHQFIGANSDLIKQAGCECYKFYGNLRRRRSVNASIPFKATSSSNMDRPVTHTTRKPTDISKDGSKYCSYEHPWGQTNNRKVSTSEITVSNVTAKFYKNNTWKVNITWAEPPEGTAFTDYLVFWDLYTYNDNSQPIEYCRVLPKNVTFTILDEADDTYNYPNRFSVLVVLLPAFKYYKGSIPMIDFEPYLAHAAGIPVTLEPPREIRHGAIVAGVLAGILFIVVLVILLYRRKTCGASQPLHHITMQDNNNADVLTKVNNTSKPQNVDTFFASYLPESEKYSTDVATIVYKLGLMGYKVVFDKVDSVRMNEIGFNMWVDKHILEAKKYIVFCSAGYVKLWQSLASTSWSESKFDHVSDQDLVRVRYEIKRISDVYSENCSTSRIICIKMDSKMSTKYLPPWMNHNMLSWPEEKDDIMRRLNDQTAMVMHV